LLRADLESFVVSLPPISEQKKITDILSTVDDVIHKTTQIIEKTKELKNGLRQRLLTRGIGHKELKITEIGQIPVDWEVVKIKDIVKKFYKEQKKIAKSLSSIDDELEKESNHRDQLILLKKGLMQVLLTGKLRVA
jgi:type I restriction enzyme S subunit